MAITLILIERLASQTRAVAMDGDQPVALFIDSPLLGSHAFHGEPVEARLVRSDQAQGGAFFVLASGEEAFFRGNLPDGLSEGGKVTARIAAAARRGKLARLNLPKSATAAPRPRLDAWRSRLPSADNAQIEEIQRPGPEITAAFEDALAATVSLPGGGVLRLAETPALTAIDIDTSGRVQSGSDSARARAVNLIAAETAARQLALSRLGGLIVLDCLAPIAKPVGAEIKARFLDTFRSLDERKAAALAPSPFGLMELSLAWRETPFAHFFQDEHGATSPLGAALDGLRQLEAEARARPADRLVLGLPARALDRARTTPDLMSRLDATYGARLGLAQSKTDSFQVRPA